MKSYHVGDCRESAAWLDDFTFPWLSISPPKTGFRAWVTGQALKFEFVAEDENVVLGEGESENERVLDSDRVEIFLASRVDLSPCYYSLEMAPNGEVFSSRAKYYRQVEAGFDFPGFNFEGRLSEDGYEVSGQFSLEGLDSLSLINDGQMIVGLYRAEFSRLGQGEILRNWISWIDPGTKTPDFHVPQSFGRFILP